MVSRALLTSFFLMVFREPWACRVSRDTERGRESLSTMPRRKFRYLGHSKPSDAEVEMTPRSVYKARWGFRCLGNIEPSKFWQFATASESVGHAPQEV